MEVFFDVPQGGPEWLKLHVGLPTASDFKTVLATGRGSDSESKTRRTYLLKKAGEILTGEPMETYSNANMERGTAMEDDARIEYAMDFTRDVQRVGFIRDGRKGCSPDGLIGMNGAIEIKTAFPHIHLEMFLTDRFPAQHVAQCQGVLWVAQREWIDLVVYWPRLPLVVRRMYRDDAYIAKLSEAVDLFNAELDQIVRYVRRAGGGMEQAA